MAINANETTFKDRLRKAMSDKRYTVSILEYKSGVPRASIYKYLDSNNRPGKYYVSMLADALGVNKGWLLYGIEESVSKFTEEEIERNRKALLNKPHAFEEEEISNNGTFDGVNVYPFMETEGHGHGTLYGHATLGAIEEAMIEQGKGKAEIDKVLYRTKEWF